jgi:hypothetical protein
MWRRIPVPITVMVVAASIALPGARGLPVPSALAAQPAQAAHNCQNIQLSVGFQGSQGAAGTIVNIYRLHNLFGQACTLYGYPGVQLLDKQFQSVHTVVHRGLPVGKAIPKKLVHVAAHGNAYFTLLYNDVPVNNQPCETAYYLMVFAPNDFLPIVTYAAPHGGSITPCTGNLYVSPVTARPRSP